MPSIDLLKECEVSRSIRARQVEALFDVPVQEKTTLRWRGDLPIEADDWQIGLIVGPSGCGKSSIAQEIFKKHYHPQLKYVEKCVLDDVEEEDVEKITRIFNAVGFGTIPAWLRPYSVLSNGERFRADLARRLLDLESPIVVDEFTSVVDRTVAQVGCHAVQKAIRSGNKKFVAVSCHSDIIDWLQPDWIFEPATMSFSRRLLRRRPSIDLALRPVKFEAWRLFAPYHYMSAELNKTARCFGLFVGDQIVSFAGVLHFPHPRVKNIKALSRMVTLPDWQGLGLAFVTMCAVGGMYSALGYRFRIYPAHPSFVRSCMQDGTNWIQVKKAGSFSSFCGVTGNGAGAQRPCAVFEYVGKPFEDKNLASEFINARN
jgi:ABC-type lipoprotein export system ATPase subunit